MFNHYQVDIMLRKVFQNNKKLIKLINIASITKSFSALFNANNWQWRLEADKPHLSDSYLVLVVVCLIVSALDSGYGYLVNGDT